MCWNGMETRPSLLEGQWEGRNVRKRALHIAVASISSSASLPCCLGWPSSYHWGFCLWRNGMGCGRMFNLGLGNLPLYALLLCVCGLAPVRGIGEGIVRLGCATNASVPSFYHRSFFVNTTLKLALSHAEEAEPKSIPLAANFSLVSDALLSYGSNLLTAHPSVGVIMRECVLSFVVDPNDRLLVAALVGLSERVACCFRLRFKPESSDSFGIMLSVQFQETSQPHCDTTHHLPSRSITSTSRVANSSEGYACPLQGIIPSDLIQDPVHSRCDMLVIDEISISCFEGFIGTGWFVVRLWSETKQGAQRPNTQRSAFFSWTERFAQPNRLRILRRQGYFISTKPCGLARCLTVVAGTVSFAPRVALFPCLTPSRIVMQSHLPHLFCADRIW